MGAMLCYGSDSSESERLGGLVLGGLSRSHGNAVGATLSDAGDSFSDGFDATSLCHCFPARPPIAE